MRIKLSKEDFIAKFEQDQQAKAARDEDIRKQCATDYARYKWDMQSKAMRKHNWPRKYR